MGSIMTESRRLVKGGMVSIVTSPWSIPLKVLRVGWDGFSTLTEMLLPKTAENERPLFLCGKQSGTTDEFRLCSPQGLWRFFCGFP